jgi:hypothetical protein
MARASCASRIVRHPSVATIFFYEHLMTECEEISPFRHGDAVAYRPEQGCRTVR